MLRIEGALDPGAPVSARPHGRLTSPSPGALLRNTLRNLAEGGLRALDIVTHRAFLVVRGRAY